MLITEPSPGHYMIEDYDGLLSGTEAARLINEKFGVSISLTKYSVVLEASHCGKWHTSVAKITALRKGR